MVDVDEIKVVIAKAKDTYSDARKCMEIQIWDTAVNRLYYAMFQMVSALLLSRNVRVKSHKGVESKFYEEFVKTEIFSVNDKALSQWPSYDVSNDMS